MMNQLMWSLAQNQIYICNPDLKIIFNFRRIKSQLIDLLINRWYIRCSQSKPQNKQKEQPFKQMSNTEEKKWSSFLSSLFVTLCLCSASNGLVTAQNNCGCWDELIRIVFSIYCQWMKLQSHGKFNSHNMKIFIIFICAAIQFHITSLDVVTIHNHSYVH